MNKEEWLKVGYVAEPVDKALDLKTEIEKLRKEKNAVILGHYYQSGEIQDIADFVGDSLALAQWAAKTDADIIVMCGVHFMGETAKVLCPEKKVLVPDFNAGCSLADSCPADDFAKFVKEHPDHTVISYVNTTAAVKAVTDVVVTSTNAKQIVDSFPQDAKLIFGPDRNLGAYIKKLTGRDNMVIWNGACNVHEEFSLEKIRQMKSLYPQAKTVVHPECPAAIIEEADYVGSTAGILEYCGKSESSDFIVVTEAGIITEMQKRYPEKRFIPAPAVHEAKCNECHYMKMVNLENILKCMEEEKDDLCRYLNLFGYNPKYGVEGKPIGSVTYKPQRYDPAQPLYET